jgi:hypothetical protein
MCAPTGRDLEDILDDAVGALAPADEDQCRIKIGDRIEELRGKKHERASIPEIRAAVEAHLKAVRTVYKTAVNLRAIAGIRQSLAFIFQVEGELDRAIDNRKIFFEIARPEPAAQRKDRAAEAAVNAALDLMVDSQREPTLYINGPWCKLSALLYEAVTKEHDADLSHYCRARAKWPRNMSSYFDPDFEPIPVLKGKPRGRVPRR